MTTVQATTKLDALIRRLDDAVTPADDEVRCRTVQQVPRLPVSAPDSYARCLLHRDPAARYGALVMVWDRSQGTLLHDHAGMWCVEGVVHGRIRVTSYSVCGGDPAIGVVRAGDAPAVTLHVYGGEMTACHVYEPVAGGWRRRFKTLGYTP